MSLAPQRLPCLALLLGLASGCAQGSGVFVHAADGDRIKLAFEEDFDPAVDAPEAPIAALFRHEPLLMRRLKGRGSPWIFIYRAEVEGGAWNRAKGPMTVTLDPDSYFNFNYIVEDFDAKLGVTYERLKLGGVYATRYFIPAGEKPGERRLYVVGLYDDEPIDWSWYRKFGRIIATVRIAEPGGD